jgi:hypothetical protein
VFAREDATQADLVAALTDVITQSGFVVDGLDGLPDHSDIDQFLHHALKMRGLDAELPRNPLYIVQYTFLTRMSRRLCTFSPHSIATASSLSHCGRSRLCWELARSASRMPSFAGAL